MQPVPGLSTRKFTDVVSSWLVLKANIRYSINQVQEAKTVPSYELLKPPETPQAALKKESKIEYLNSRVEDLFKKRQTLEVEEFVLVWPGATKKSLC